MGNKFTLELIVVNSVQYINMYKHRSAIILAHFKILSLRTATPYKIHPKYNSICKE